MSYLSANHCLLQLESWSPSFWLCVGGVIDGCVSVVQLTRCGRLDSPLLVFHSIPFSFHSTSLTQTIIYIYICMYVYVCVCMCMYVCMYVYIYTYIYIFEFLVGGLLYHSRKGARASTVINTCRSTHRTSATTERKERPSFVFL